MLSSFQSVSSPVADLARMTIALDAACRAYPWLTGWSQVEDQVVAWLGAADEYAAVGGVVDRGGGVADCSGDDGCLAGVAHSGAA
jgi:hypothetical protein